MGGIYNSFNLCVFCYGASNPLRYADPDGNYLIPMVIVVAIVGVKLMTYSGNANAPTDAQDVHRNSLGDMIDAATPPARSVGSLTTGGIMRMAQGQAKYSDAASFEKNLSTRKTAGERVGYIKEVLPEVAQKHGLTKDSRLSRKTGREVLKNEKGEVFSVDTQHGRFEKINPKTGRHEGEYNFDMVQTKPADKSGKHDLDLK